jgi:hypothetical protein
VLLSLLIDAVLIMGAVDAQPAAVKAILLVLAAVVLMGGAISEHRQP